MIFCDLELIVIFHLNHLTMANSTLSDIKPSSAPFHAMTKPIGPICNIGCEYCFYLEKENLFEATEKFRMSDELLETYVRNYIESHPRGAEINFAWQGGEPTLLGVAFFRKAVALEKKYGEGRKITNAFQTNGTLLNDEWCEFFKENEFLIGLSIDGPKELHDTYRVTKNQEGTFDKVMKGLDFLKKHEVPFNTLTCVNRVNSKHPLKVYRFLKSIGSEFMQFIPIVERRPDSKSEKLGLDLASPPVLDSHDEEDDPRFMPWSVKAKDYGDFLVQIFDRWLRKDVGKVYVQLHDVAFGKWLGMKEGGICVFSETCGRAMAVEHDGKVYACDHFVYPEFEVGDLAEEPLSQIVDSDAMTKFGNDKKDLLPEYCKNCEVLFACNGGCPKHRTELTPDGEPGLNYLCAGYKQFFKHIDPAMRGMAQLYKAGRPPAEIMKKK